MRGGAPTAETEGSFKTSTLEQYRPTSRIGSCLKKLTKSNRILVSVYRTQRHLIRKNHAPFQCIHDLLGSTDLSRQHGLRQISLHMRPSKQHLAFTICLYLFVGLALYGLFNRNNFIPSDQFDSVFIVLSLGCALLITIWTYTMKSPHSKIASWGSFKKVFLFPVLLVFFYGFAWCALKLGVGLLYTEQFGIPSASKLQISTKMPEHRGRGCHHRLALTGAGLPPNFTPCVPEALWQNSKERDSLTAELRTSAFGISLMALSPTGNLPEKKPTAESTPKSEFQPAQAQAK